MISSIAPTQPVAPENQLIGLNTDSPELSQFLQLLITQLEHQDPLKPMEAKEFTAQLATFSLLEQAIQTNQALKTLNMYEEMANNTLALNLIGKEIRAQGNTIQLRDQGGSEISFGLHEAVAESQIFISNEMGDLIRMIPLGRMSEGEHVVHWDGRDHSGGFVPEGNYRVAVVGKDDQGNHVEVEHFLQGRVESVQIKDGKTSVIVGGVPIPLGEILEVRES